MVTGVASASLRTVAVLLDGWSGVDSASSAGIGQPR